MRAPCVRYAFQKDNKKGKYAKGEASRNVEVEGKQNSLFPTEPVSKCFVITLNSKIEEIAKKCLPNADLHANSPLFKEHRLIMWELI